MHSAGQLQQHHPWILTAGFWDCSTTASSHRTGSAGFAGNRDDPRCRRHRCAQVAKVEYLIPTNAANFAPLKPLRSNSSSKLSRRAAGVRTRPNPSVFNNAVSPASVVFVIALRYDIYEMLE